MNYLQHLREKTSDLDYLTLAIVLALTIIGLFSIYSASSVGESSHWSLQFVVQLIALFLGLIFFVMMYVIPKQFLLNNAWFFYIAGVLLLLIPFFTSGTIAETNRWIDLKIVRIQPSEFMKFILILILARYFSTTKNSAEVFRYVFKPLFLTLLPFILVFIQPDLGTSIIYLAVFIGMLYASGYRVYYIFLLIAPMITIVAAFNLTAFTIWGIILGIIIFFNQANIFASVGIFIGNIATGLITPLIWNHLKPYQQTRILTMFNAKLDPLGAGYQVLQSQIAIGSGGLRGKGFMAGTQTHLRFLPEQHTDFIFSVIAEELGFFMVVILFILFFTLFTRWFRMAYQARDKFGAMLIVGGTMVLLIHFFINIGMTVGLLPVTGKPLPFLSYGGSFLVTCYGLVGMILNGNSEQIPRALTYR
ncbi:MAG: rod shape-determining protein RodA [Candidatus Neomarinimicrobiota bacterium]|nr:MAG: rod shape-determining protein RodA [Candidatus Neomarinimicrobiota bacterium]